MGPRASRSSILRGFPNASDGSGRVDVLKSVLMDRVDQACAETERACRRALRAGAVWLTGPSCCAHAVAKRWMSVCRAQATGHPGCRTVCSIRSAASDVSSCSHTRTTVHPASLSAWLLRLSRSAVQASFVVHQSRFDFGSLMCSGHECHQQESIKQTTRARVNTKSAVQRRPGSGLMCLR
jgi:hypothetical protein